jgi:predicted NAD/FAD-dependent oxidoreductase
MMSICIIGAGITGLAAATHLAEAGVENIVILDKGRSVGGRLATRRLASAKVDHGAQFVSAKTSTFQEQWLQPWLDEGELAVWFGDANHARYRARSGMNGWAKKISTQLPVNYQVKTEATVQRLTRAEQWSVEYEDAQGEPHVILAYAILLTMPVPQILGLLHEWRPQIAEHEWQHLAAVHYNPCVALLIELEQSSSLPTPGVIRAQEQPSLAPLALIADNQQKGISAHCGLTVHLDGIWSAQNYNLSDKQTIEYVLPLLQPWVDGRTITKIDVKRWRYAQSSNLFPAPYLSVIRPSLVLAGDGFAMTGESHEQGKIETSWHSGISAARYFLNNAK